MMKSGSLSEYSAWPYLRLISLPLLLCAIAAIAGCHRDSSQAPPPQSAPQASAPVAAPRGPTLGELTAGMVEAASQGKSQAPVTLKFDLSQKPAVGKPLDIALALLSQIPASSATIAVTSSEGLELPPEARPIELPALEPGQVYRQTIQVTPTGEGVFLVSVSVGLKHDEMTDSRVFSVPIIVASARTSAGGPSSAGGPPSAPSPKH
jgi:hypothetical protein